MNIHISPLVCQHSFDPGIVDISWTDNSPIEDGVYHLVKNSKGYPLDVYDGDTVYVGTNKYYKDSDVEEGKIYCYTLFIEKDSVYYSASDNRDSIIGPYNYDYGDYMWKRLVWTNYKKYTSAEELKALFNTFGKFFGGIKSKIRQIDDIFHLRAVPIKFTKVLYERIGVSFRDNLPVDYYSNELTYFLLGAKAKGTESGIKRYLYWLFNFNAQILYKSAHKSGFYSCEYNGSITFDPDIHRVQDLGTHRDILKRTIDYSGYGETTYLVDLMYVFIFIPFNTYRHSLLYERACEILNNYFPEYVSIIPYPMYFSDAVLDKELDNLVEYTLG